MLDTQELQRKMSPFPYSLFFFLTIGLLVFASCKGNDEDEVTEEDAEKIYFEDYDSPSSKWGYVNQSGLMIIESKYDETSKFSDGLAAVNYRGKWGYIDSAGEQVTAFSYKAAWPMVSGRGRAITFLGEWVWINQEGKEITIPELEQLYDLADGRARFEQNFLTGFLDKQGHVRIEPVFERASNFKDGYAVVRRNGKEGIIDTTGNLIIDISFDRIRHGGPGFALLKNGEQWSFFRVDSQERMEGTWSWIDGFFEGYAAVIEEGNAVLIDLSGNRVSEEYANLRYAGENRWICEREGLFGIVHPEKGELTQIRFGQINNFSCGKAAYQLGDYWGYLDLNGELFTPPQFGLVWDFQEGYARAAFRDGIAYIDTTGSLPFYPDYSEIRDFSEGLAAVQEW